MQRNTDSYHQDAVGGTTWHGPERRQRQPANKELVAEILAAIGETHRPLTDEERQWVRLAIQREAQSIKLRQAIIEKTLGGLVWAAIIAAGVILFEYLKSHGVDLTVKN